MPYAHANGIRLYYETSGDANETLVIIPGLGGNHTSWGPLVPKLSETLRVLVFDNRGSGLSDKPPGPYTMDQFADDLAGLLDHLDLASAHVLGSSMGGAIALHFALRHPSRARSLVLGCTSAGGPMSTRPGQDVLDAMVSASELPPEYAMELHFRITYSDGFVDANHDMLVRRDRERRHLRTTPEAYQAQLAAAGSHDNAANLHRIAQPTLIIHGTGDRLIPWQNAEALARGLPSAELVLLDGVGHGLHIEARERVERLVLDFVGR